MRQDQPQIKDTNAGGDSRDVNEVEHAKRAQSEVGGYGHDQKIGRGTNGRPHTAQEHGVVHWQEHL